MPVFQMNQLTYYIYKVFAKLIHNNELIIRKYRKLGMKIGNNTHIFCNIVSSEPYLISIGNNSTISTNVSLLTHDSSIGAIGDRNLYSDLCGRIRIGDHCFIGNNSIIMYGVDLGDRSIVAAGAVVTKSFPDGNVVLAGNPAKVVCKADDFYNKSMCNGLKLHGHKFSERKRIILSEEAKLVKRKIGTIK